MKQSRQLLTRGEKKYICIQDPVRKETKNPRLNLEVKDPVDLESRRKVFRFSS